jgi:hypothetical protein
VYVFLVYLSRIRRIANMRQFLVFSDNRHGSLAVALVRVITEFCAPGFELSGVKTVGRNIHPRAPIEFP